MMTTGRCRRATCFTPPTTLTGLGYVVMDEVHYLADRFRGAVWKKRRLFTFPSM